MNEELFWDVLEERTYVCCGCYMLKTESFFKIYPECHIPEYHVGQNFQMLLPFLFRYKCPTIPEKLYGVCVRSNSHSRSRLTRKEEEQRYQEYENLIDEIAEICHIDDKDSKERIAYWKARRRYILAIKYRCGRQIFSSCCQMYRCRDLNGFKLLKDFIWNSISRCRSTVKQLMIGKQVHSVRCRKKRVALTFDDGYEHTMKILDKLEQYHIKSTFFMVGDWIEQNPMLCWKVFEMGHEIGNHSYSHFDMTDLSEAEACEEVKRVQRLIRKVTGKECILFRFPYGKCNLGLTELVKKQGLKAVKWSIESCDWMGIDAETICKNVLGSKKLKRGAIVLLHTTHYETVEALDLLIPALKRKGYELVRVSDLIHKK